MVAGQARQIEIQLLKDVGLIRIPWLGRRALAERPRMRSRNVLAGYLLRTAVSMGLIGYRQIVLQRSG